ncbi:MAG: amphi-Trp domain-containing protein [Candidatus Bathyarchaeota archaeon]|nr:amphi-Trp domain-containing protein [Candidatus Bathyarchaeota archaeon]
MEIPKENISSRRKEVIGDFSQEFYMGRIELASFLRNLADQVETQGALRITTEDWVLAFDPMDMVKVDVDLDESELEIEIEFKKSTGNLQAEKIKPS